MASRKNGMTSGALEKLRKAPSSDPYNKAGRAAGRDARSW